MKRVTGIGGIFFKANDPSKLHEWYEKHLGLKRESSNYSMLRWREADDPEKIGKTVWSLFKKDSKYFDPSQSGFMINYRVRFAWIMDPEGNRIELWEPPAGG